MSRIVAYKSPHTGELFEHKKDYDNHLRRIYRANSLARKLEAKANELEARWAVFRESITDVSQLPQAIIDNQDLFWETAEKNSFSYDFEICRKIGIYPKLVEFTEFNLRYNERVSNSHSCPADGVTNWGGRVEGAPRGYPGWQGQINWIVEWPHKHSGEYPGGQLFKGSRIHIGTGGGGGTLIRAGNECQSFGHSSELFLSDWRGLEKSLFIRKLKGKGHVR